MDIQIAILLGILQGLTEFFPVSSSGHLALFGSWFGLSEPDLTFDILVHLATLLAILVYFRRDWSQLARLILKRERGDLPPMVLPLLLLSMVPAGLVALFFKDQVEWMHARPAMVGVCLLVNGVVLLAGLKMTEGKIAFNSITPLIVVGMGCAQALAILPGISRSGATIMCALMLGMGRRDGARFSFFMAVPVISGAGLLAVKDLLEQPAARLAELWPAYGAGFIAAAAGGFFALVFLMKLLEGRRFFYFGFYCLVLGLSAVLFG
ncbi:MAG: undecaprenyl-diphosphate phosphatase [Acidobacteriota bacterium]|nr:undecaprenyl-diphosphate phosphatase [Acidobacteriota bacterium]